MLSEQDEELLEAYLDDSLSPDEVGRLVKRLADDVELRTALDTMREQRRLRVQAWESLEPTEAEASALAAKVLRGVRRQRMISLMSVGSRFAGLAAACLLLGLGGGWYMWGRAPALPTRSGSTPVAVSTTSDHPQGNIQFVNQPGSNLPAGGYQVALTDDNGNVLTVQKFNKLEEAQHFAEDLGHVVERQQDVQNGHVTLVSDHF